VQTVLDAADIVKDDDLSTIDGEAIKAENSFAKGLNPARYASRSSAGSDSCPAEVGE